MLKMLPLILLILLITGCFNSKTDSGDEGKGVILQRVEKNLKVISKENFIAGEYLVNKEITSDSVKTGEGKLSLVTKDGNGNSIVSIVVINGEIIKDQEIFTIENCADETKVKEIKIIDKDNIETEMKKAAKAGEGKKVVRTGETNLLLGDFNNDNTVNMVDFIAFASNYGGDIKYDIAPATKGTGEWAGIYSVKSSDGVVNLLDFMVFANNYGTTINPKIVLTGLDTVEEGGTIELTSNMSVTWISSDTSIATVSPTTGIKTVVTGVKAGTVAIKAVSGTAEATYLIAVIQRNVPKAVSITVSGDSVINEGKTATLTGIVKYSNGDEKSEILAWSSSDATIGKCEASGTTSTVTGVKAGTITITATNGTITSVPKTITIKAVEQTGITIYVEKPLSWSNIFIWYDSDLTTPAWDTSVLASSPGDMVEYRPGWYKKNIPTTSTVEFLFNDGTWANKMDTTGPTTSPTVNFKTTSNNIWITKDGKVFTYDMSGPQKPAITLDSTGGYFKPNKTVKATFTSETTVTSKKYTLNGVEKELTGDTITFGDNLADGDKVTLSISATNAQGTTTVGPYTFIKGTQPKSTGLGAAYTSQSTTFKIWSPDTSNVVVNVDGKDYNCTKLPDSDGYTNVYGVTVTGDLHMKEYQFKINGNSVRDPNGVMVNNSNGKNIVMDMSVTDPDGGWVARPALVEREDSIVYEVHVRDFSIAENSGVDSNKRGKYLGMVQTGTVNGSVKTGIDHLKELGVTHVQILPFFDFDSDEEYNWGYNPVNFNIPEERYCSNPSDYIKRIKEVKTMINEFHKNGIRVVMDVVYNHTSDPSGNVFSGITQKYYFPLGDPRNGMAGCGRALNSSEPMTSRFIQDSLNFWVNEYKIDGFRFDLIGNFIYTEVNKWGDSLNKNNPNENLLIYGEPWDGYYDNGDARNTDSERSNRFRYGKLPALAGNHIGAFNNKIRDGIRGNGDHIGTSYRAYMHNYGDNAGLLRTAMVGSLLDSKSTNILGDAWAFPFAYDPEQTINYVSAHDNLCLWDKIIMEGFNGETAKKMDKMANGIVLTAQGIPFIHAGDEILRTKGNDLEVAKNSYNKGDGPNKIDWSWKSANSDVFDFYKEIIKMRRTHAGFRMTDWDKVKANVSSSTSGQIIITKINGAAVGDSWKNIIVVSNPNPNTPYSLPITGTWKVFAEKGSANVVRNATGTVSCEGPNVTILYQD